METSSQAHSAQSPHPNSPLSSAKGWGEMEHHHQLSPRAHQPACLCGEGGVTSLKVPLPIYASPRNLLATGLLEVKQTLHQQTK